jgi:hypothetical protein
MKALVIFIGECFRLGTQHSRIKGHDKTYEEQIEACKTHQKLLSSFEFDYDLIVNTCTTQFDEDLKSMYNAEFKFHEKAIGLVNYIYDALESVDLSKYDFVYACRIDLILKDHFIETFKIGYDKITYLSRIENRLTGIRKDKTMVNDMMIYVPKHCYDVFGKKLDLMCHHASTYLKQNEIEFDLMSDLTHCSNTQTGSNPFYFIANRVRHSECSNCNTFGIYYKDKDLFVIKKAYKHPREQNPRRKQTSVLVYYDEIYEGLEYTAANQIAFPCTCIREATFILREYVRFEKRLKQGPDFKSYL